MTTPTANFAWAKPVVGADSDTWGTELNALADAVDAQVALYLLKSGGTLTGDLLFTDATYDIGKTGATRPRDIFASRNVTAGGLLTAAKLIASSFTQNNIAAGTWYTAIAVASLPSNGRLECVLYSNFNINSVSFDVLTSGATVGNIRVVNLQVGASTLTAQIDGSGNVQIRDTANATSNITLVWKVLSA